MARLDEADVDLVTVKVCSLTFTDVEALMAESAKYLQRMMSRLDASAKGMGLKIIVNKKMRAKRFK